MTEPDFVGYALQLTDATERAEVESFLAAHPDSLGRLERVHAAIAPLEVDREGPAPPPALAVRTVAALARLLVAPQPGPSTGSGVSGAEPAAAPAGSRLRPFPPDRADLGGTGGRFRFDLVIAAGISLIAVGLIVSFVGRIRYQSDVVACQNNLRMLGQGLTGYADTHNNRFPQVGVEAYPTAGSFVAALTDAGQCPPNFHAICPAAPPVAEPDLASTTIPVTYTYTLGHVAPTGGILGLSRSTDPGDENDLLPVSADYPAGPVSPRATPTSPHLWGHNVLFTGGNVRFATTATVGVNGDDIYRNQRGVVAAGVHRADAVLGGAATRP